MSRIRLQPRSGWSFGNARELWAYRDLLVILAGRDIKLRYKQTLVGAAWVVLQPLIAALIFTVIFGRLAKVPSDGLPYMAFAFTSLVGWNYFSGVVTRAGGSLVGQANLVRKIYFPRIAIPLAGLMGVWVDLAVGVVVMFVVALAHGLSIGPEVAALPAFLALITVTACGVSLWVSSLSAYYRDFVHALPFVLQIWMYVTPVVFPASLLPAEWRWLFALNPLASGVEGVRWAVLGQGVLTSEMIAASCIVATLLLLSGLLVFDQVERRLADVI